MNQSLEKIISRLIGNENICLLKPLFFKSGVITPVSLLLYRLFSVKTPSAQEAELETGGNI